MIFPIGDDQVKGGYFPLFSYGFIVLNVAVFIFENQLPQAQLATFVNEFGSIPNEITHGKDWFTLLTSMFLHGSWMHLIGNMLFLWVFADNIEATVGNVSFLLFYVIGGLAAVGGHIYFNWNSAIPMVGASGAISAVMGAYLVMYPRSRVKLLFFIFPFRVSAWLFLGIWIIQQMSYGAASLNTAEGEGVAWWAHISGFAFGLLAGLAFRSSGRMEEVELENPEG
ncbi:MAG: rhomboid family intramembrane serine protease [Saprospiraceae bacterium]